MSKQNFKSQAKRKRELAKLDKRTAKDQKRAAKKAEGSDVVAVPGAVAPAAPLAGAARGAPAAASPAPAPLTLAQVVERWKTTKIVKPPKYR
jgi:hypothetical protein